MGLKREVSVSDKEALSSIVATLIIILLAIVAFGLVSGVFQDLLTERSERFDAESSQIRLDIQKASVEGNESQVTFRRKGSGNEEIAGASFVFESENSNAVMEKNFSLEPQELDTKSIPLCEQEFSDIDFSDDNLKITVYPIIDYEGERITLESKSSSIEYVNVGDYNLTQDCSSGSDSGGSQCTDSDGDGWNKSASCNSNGPGDCNDSNSSLNPETVWYKDADSDGHYVSNTTQCNSPGADWRLNISGNIESQGDCNDTNSEIYENSTWYEDSDGDGYYISNVTQCNPPNNYDWFRNNTGQINSKDCNDDDPNVYPGEGCEDGGEGQGITL